MAPTKPADCHDPRMTGLPEVVGRDLARNHRLRNSVLVLGNFDGFHLGHQALVRMAHGIAGGRPVSVMSCEPHPRSFFSPGTIPFRLATPASKRWLLGQFGVGFIYSPTFDEEFAGLDPLDFVEEILFAALGVSHVIAGSDFRFGKRRAGDVYLLSKLASARGIGVSVASDIAHAGMRVSSTLVRAAIEEGDLSRATLLLGHDWIVETERRPDGTLELHRDLCRPRAGQYLGSPMNSSRLGKSLPIHITEDGKFVPLGPQPVRDAPEIWRLNT